MKFLDINSIKQSILNSAMVLFALLFSSFSTVVFAEEGCEAGTPGCLIIIGNRIKPIDPWNPWLRDGGGNGNFEGGGFEGGDVGEGGGGGSGGSSDPETPEQCRKRVAWLENRCITLYAGLGAVSAGFCHKLKLFAPSWSVSCKVAVGVTSVRAFQWCTLNAKSVQVDEC